MMQLRPFLLQLVLLLSPNLQLPREAAETLFQDRAGSSRTARNIQAPLQSNTTGFTVEYTLITANSPDCEPSLVNNFPVRVQYRAIIGGEGEASSASISEWVDSPNTPGKH